MILREIFYFNRDTGENEENEVYDPKSDDSPVKSTDKRVTRLTLKQIRRVRIACEKHREVQKKELDFVRQMYGTPEQPAQPGF